MKLIFIADASLHIAGADGFKAYDYKAGETATVPDDIAAMFIAAGHATPAKAERAVKAKGETATK
jgi:hypothetical protein